MRADPPVIAYQAESIEAFLLDVVAMWQPGQRSPVDRMHEEDVHRIWRDDSGLLTPAAAAGSDDPVLAAFATALPVEARIADLRGARAGNASGPSFRRSGRRD
jgi:hypothetical protein